MCFGKGEEIGWTSKMVMAWAWPSVELTDDALMHYSGGPISVVQRDTTRFLEILLLSVEGGEEVFKRLIGYDSRFRKLEGDVSNAAKLLSEVVRGGVINPDSGEQREGLGVHARRIHSLHAPKSMPAATLPAPSRSAAAPC